jgi:hypothetical protein
MNDNDALRKLARSGKWTEAQLQRIAETPELAENLRKLMAVNGGGTIGEQVSAQMSRAVAGCTVAAIWLLIIFTVLGILWVVFFWSSFSHYETSATPAPTVEVRRALPAVDQEADRRFRRFLASPSATPTQMRTVDNDGNRLSQLIPIKPIKP